MPLLVGPALVVGGLLALAGALKVLDPTMTVGALRATGLAVTPGLVRAGAAAEGALGVAVLVVGGPVLWYLAAASYAAFALFVVAALREGSPLGSCGCFGRADTPARWSHVGLDVALVALAAASAGLDRAPLDELADRPGAGAAVGVLAVVALTLVFLAFTRPAPAEAG